MYKAEATVETAKASRYLKALCNHFNRKVTAEYDDNQGNVQFGFADCELLATDGTLRISVTAENEENFGRVKNVVSDHLERFSGNEALQLSWDASSA